MKKFLFLFTIADKIVWSGDNEAQLKNRKFKVPDREVVDEFIEHAQPGDHISLSTGEMVIRSR